MLKGFMFQAATLMLPPPLSTTLPTRSLGLACLVFPMRLDPPELTIPLFDQPPSLEKMRTLSRTMGGGATS
jgi:hypothetical protein